MALVENSYIDSAEVLADGQIQLRVVRAIIDDVTGEEVARQNVRSVLDPGIDDINSVASKTSGLDTKIDIQSIVNAIWTTDRVAERKAFLSAPDIRGTVE
jgi:hypothetical protein